MNEEIKTEKKKKPKGRIIFSLFILIFCVMLGFISLYGFFVTDREMSETENRVLAKMPVFTLSGLADGSFMKDFESYLTDQFPLRDEAIYLKSFVERLWGKSEENGVYIGKSGFLFEKPSDYDEEKMNELAKQIKAFSQNNGKLKTVFTLVPNSSYIYGENLPDNLILPDQKNQINSFYSLLGKDFACVDAVTPLLKEKSLNQVFYRTDHHWTTRGAYSVFLAVMQKMGIEVKDGSYEFHTVSAGFEGTLKSKSLSQPVSDHVEICFPKKSQGTYYVEFSGSAEKKASFFFEDRLDTRNKYEIFLGGNYEKLTVTTTLYEGRKLVVVKDSFANCLLPMLTPYFSKIVVVDPRYMTENLSKLLQEDDFTDLLFLYNANTLFGDSSLSSVL